MSSSGIDLTVEIGMIQSPGEGYVADMAEEGEPLLIADAAMSICFAVIPFLAIRLRARPLQPT